MLLVGPEGDAGYSRHLHAGHGVAVGKDDIDMTARLLFPTATFPRIVPLTSECLNALTISPDGLPRHDIPDYKYSKPGNKIVQVVSIVLALTSV